jgi:prepilin-type N-terminal cleavage/methylation domain-containing protein
MRGREAGFTVIEMVAVLLIGGVAMALAAGTLVHAHRSAGLAGDSAGVVREATRALGALEADLRGATAVEEAGPDLLRCASPEGPVAWIRVGGDLVREAGGRRSTLLRGLRSLEARSRDGLVEVTLRYGPRPGGGTPPPLHTSVAMPAWKGDR